MRPSPPQPSLIGVLDRLAANDLVELKDSLDDATWAQLEFGLRSVAGEAPPAPITARFSPAIRHREKP